MVSTSSEIDNFMVGFREAESDLKWIREASQRTKRFIGNDEFEEKVNFPKNKFEDVRRNGDAWYNRFRKEEIEKDDFYFEDEPVLEDPVLKDDPAVLEDQIEETKNDLSHEANYKLSKIEQEKMENIPVKMEKPQNFKRSLDDEINLKISNKMMSKGLSASLPSDSLKRPPKSYPFFEETDEIIYPDSVTVRVPNYNLFKREENFLTGRKLLEFQNMTEMHTEMPKERPLNVSSHNLVKRSMRRSNHPGSGLESESTQLNDLMTGKLPIQLVKVEISFLVLLRIFNKIELSGSF